MVTQGKQESLVGTLATMPVDAMLAKVTATPTRALSGLLDRSQEVAEYSMGVTKRCFAVRHESDDFRVQCRACIAVTRSVRLLVIACRNELRRRLND